MAYDHLGLSRWPFPTVPERDFCTFIADRELIRKDLDALLRSLARQDTSDIHLLWSWFGAGKTHTLYYLANRCEQTRESLGTRLYSIYSEFPKAPRSFVDIYRCFILGLDTDDIVDAYLEAQTAPNPRELQRELQRASPDLVTALHVLSTGTYPDQLIASRWLRGEALPAAQFRSVGIQQKVATAEEASRILTSIVRLMVVACRSRGSRGARFVWLLDEFQRIEQLGTRLRDEINIGLHSTFNSCPTGLTIVFSFSGTPRPTLPGYFTNEMRDRIGLTKVMILPPLRKDEAMTFVADVLKNLRTVEAYNADTYFPFSEAACQVIIDDVAARNDLKPRSLMQAFDAVLQEAEVEILEGRFDLISPEFAKRVLSERISLMVREDDDE